MPVYDAVSPAPGVRVSHVPRPRVHISPSQQKAARTPETNHKGQLLGVFKLVMKGGPVCLGVLAAARELQKASPIKATSSRIPGCRRRGHPHSSANSAFAGAIPSQRAYADREVVLQDLKHVEHLREAKRELNMLRHTHSNQLKRFGSPTSFYLRLRYHCLRLFPSIFHELQRVESAQRRSMLAR